MTDEPDQPGYRSTGYTATGHDAPGPRTQAGPTPRGDSLSVHLALGFLGVALAVIALLTGLTVAFTATDVGRLATNQRIDLTQAIAAAAGASWAQASSWKSANLSQTLELASSTGADAEILDASGAPIASSARFSAQAGMPEKLGLNHVVEFSCRADSIRLRSLGKKPA